MDIEKQQIVKDTLLRNAVEYIPIFMAATPQFLDKCISRQNKESFTMQSWRYCVSLDLDIVQTSHPSFYPARFDLPRGSKWIDEWNRTHVLSDVYDDFCAPFPLTDDKKINISDIKEKWDKYSLPDPLNEKYFQNVDELVKQNCKIDNPLSVWGVINGPFEPTWQLLSDGWPEFFILARKDIDLAKDMINKIADYSIKAGKGLIDHGVDAIRIGDDYGLNHGLMCRPSTWYDLIFPAHSKLIKGLKNAGGDDFPIILHSDGNISTILEWLTQSGIDALNPIQPDAISLEDVVNKVGKNLSMTAAFDLRYFHKQYNEETHHFLKTETIKLMDIIQKYNRSAKKKDQTGFCIGPTHNIQAASNVDTFENWIKIVKEERIKRFSLI